MNIVGDNIKKMRKLRGISQDELASMVTDVNGNPLSRVTITRYENSREPSIEVLRKIAKALRVSLVELIIHDSIDSDEVKMFEILTELTLVGKMEWKLIQNISTSSDKKRQAELNSIIRILESAPGRRKLTLTDLRTNDSYYCSYNDLEYLVLTDALNNAKSIMIDIHENNNILILEDDSEGYITRLTEIIRTHKSTSYRKGIGKVIDSLSFDPK